MKSFILMTFMILAFQTQGFCQRKPLKYDRLPPNITTETKVRKDFLNAKKEVGSFDVQTVEKRLHELKARYKKNVLVDGKGREIRFYEPLCRGASAGFEQDQEDAKTKQNELTELKKKYTVVVLYCDPAQIM